MKDYFFFNDPDKKRESGSWNCLAWKREVLKSKFWKLQSRLPIRERARLLLMGTIRNLKTGHKLEFRRVPMWTIKHENMQHFTDYLASVLGDLQILVGQNPEQLVRIQFSPCLELVAGLDAPWDHFQPEWLHNSDFSWIHWIFMTFPITMNFKLKLRCSHAHICISSHWCLNGGFSNDFPKIYLKNEKLHNFKLSHVNFWVAPTPT